jgi:predicted Zn finger-like uncharacterized protein
MTLAVQCPQCQTAFKVVQDQLKVAQGWVKCGRCEQVFDAHSHWLQIDLPEPIPATNPAEPDSATVAEPLADTDAHSVAPETQASAHDTALVSTISPPAMALGPYPSDFSNPLSGHASPGPRRIWAVLIGILGLLWVAQIFWWNKSQWLAHWPQAHEWAQAACAQARCQLDWPQGLDAVMIERAHFEPDGEGHHRLQIQLSNRAKHTVATPWLDLTLTDGEDRIVIRRMLAPEEMGLPKHLSPGVDAVSSVHWRVDSDVEDRLSGYRAEIFYP